MVSPSGVTTDPEKLEAVKNCPRLTDKHQVRSFLGLCTYYTKFISAFADMAKQLARPLKEKRIFEWSTETETAFNALKEALCTAPVLGYPRQAEKFVIDTDASNLGIGEVLSQVQDGGERVVAYFRKTVSKANRNYRVSRREFLAIVKTL
jgi:hypothetical protein